MFKLPFLKVAIPSFAVKLNYIFSLLMVWLQSTGTAEHKSDALVYVSWKYSVT